MDVTDTRPAGRHGAPPAGPLLRQAGLTLLELMVTLAVVTILAGIAVPSLAGLVASNRLTAQHNALAAHLNLARSEAVRRNVQVIVCLSPDGAACGSGNAWEQGWIVFVDNDRDEHRDAGETLLRAHPALTGGTRLTYIGFPSDRFVRYYPTGITRGNGTFTFCSEDALHRQALILYKTGRLRAAHSGPGGAVLSCP